MDELREVKSTGESRRLPLQSLLLDPENPRLPSELQGMTQDDLAVHLELGFDALTVAESIASHGFFGSEPLIAIEDGPDTYVVVEGNRRLTALRGLVDTQLRGQFANPGPWEALAAKAGVKADDLVPVVVVPSRSAATPIIGFRHISGILQWQPYAQARYIARLVDENKMTFAGVADMIGVDRTKVGNLYRDQAIATQARELGIDTGPLEEAFSLMTVAMSTPRLRDHIGATLGSQTAAGEPPIPEDRAPELRELITWLYGNGETAPVIAESRDISKLGNVVASKVGLSALRSGDSLAMAVQRTHEAGVNPRQRLLLKLKAGKSSLTSAMQELPEFLEDEEVSAAVDEARAAADALLAALGHE